MVDDNNIIDYDRIKGNIKKIRDSGLPFDQVESYIREKENLNPQEVFKHFKQEKDRATINTSQKFKLEPSQRRNYFDNVVESTKRGHLSSSIDIHGYDSLIGGRGSNEVLGERDSFIKMVSEDPIKASHWLEGATYTVASMVPAMGKGILSGKATGMAFAGTAFVAGQMLPIPEELVTVPGAFAAGSLVGSAQYWYRQGAGSLYLDMKKAGIDDKTAKPVAHIGGALYGAIEFSQVDKLIPGSGGATRQLITKSVTKTVTNLTKRYGVNWMQEVGEEGLQEIVISLCNDIASQIEKKTNKRVADIAKTAMLKGWGAMKESAIPMLLLMAPGSAIETKRANETLKKEEAVKADMGKKLIESGALISEPVKQLHLEGEGKVDVPQFKFSKGNKAEQTFRILSQEDKNLNEVKADLIKNNRYLIVLDKIVPRPASEVGEVVAQETILTQAIKNAQIHTNFAKTFMLQGDEQAAAKEKVRVLQHLVKEFKSPQYYPDNKPTPVQQKAINTFESAVKKEAETLEEKERNTAIKTVLGSEVTKVYKKETGEKVLKAKTKEVPEGAWGVFYNIVKGVEKYLTGTLLLEKQTVNLDGVERGTNHALISEKINEARATSEYTQLQEINDLNTIMEQNGVKWKEYKHKRISVADLNITSEDLVDTYLYILQERSLESLLAEGIKYKAYDDVKYLSKKQVEAIKKYVEKNKKLMAMAQAQQIYYTKNTNEIFTAHYFRTGEILTAIDNYFPVSRDTLEGDYNTEINNLLLPQAKIMYSEPGVVKHTVPHAKGALRAKGLDGFIRNITLIENFKTLGVIETDVRRLVFHPAYRKAVVKARDQVFYDSMTEKIRRAFNPNMSSTSSTVDGYMKFLRRKALPTVLFKIPIVLKQSVSTLTASSEVGAKWMFSAWDMRTHNAVEFNKIADKSMVLRIRGRSVDRDIKEFQANPYVDMSWIERHAVDPIRALDLWTVKNAFVAGYLAEFDRTHNDAQAIAYGDYVVRTTQPMAYAENLSLYQSGSELSKMLTMFSNQVVKNANFWHTDIYLAYRAGKITETQAAVRILQSYIIPALLIDGLSTGGETFKDWKKVLLALGTYWIPPLFLIREFYNVVGLGYKWTPLAFKFAQHLRTSGQSVLKRDWWKGAIEASRGAGFLSGTPMEQIIISGTGAFDLKTGKTRDFRRLVWSERQLENKKKPAKFNIKGFKGLKGSKGKFKL